ncbi:micronuclear linker histone polyprotein-like [Littorina saxatilis]|uniref:Uncharacterized protein n=1 Tax=Littorina saxatilis TaxID=31220 RepID=A0AAN9BQY8_9CAEN
MPVSKRVSSQASASSVTVSTRVVESYSSMTSLKTVSHKRTSSGKMLESWLSPTLSLTSPQTWVSGSLVKFPSPPKSPPKMRVTRRSSVYVKKLGPGKSKSLASPKGIEFKVPIGLVTASNKAATSRRSSVYKKANKESSASRRSSVYSRGGTKASISAAEEETKPISPGGKKSRASPPKGNKSRASSPKGKKSPALSSSGKKAKSPASMTSIRKRVISEVEKEESPGKPAAKRRRQAVSDVSLSVSPKKASKSSPKKAKKQASKSRAKQSQASAKGVDKIPSSPKAVRKPAKKAVRSAKKTPKTRAGRSRQSKSSVHQGKAKRTEKMEEKDEDEEDADDEIVFTPPASASKTQSRRGTKRKATGGTPKDTPKRKSTTPKSSVKSRRKSPVKSTTSPKKRRSQKEEKEEELAEGSTSIPSTPKTRPTPSKRKPKTPKSKKSTPAKRNVKTPKSETKSVNKKSSSKMSASSSRQSKQATDAQINKKETSAANEEEKAITPKSDVQARRKSQGKSRSSVKKSSSVSKSVQKSARKSTPKSAKKSVERSRSSNKTSKSVSRSVQKSDRKASSEMSISFDVQDGSYLEASSAKQKKASSSVRSPLSLKKGASPAVKVVRSAEDERILEILRDAVKSTPKARRPSTPMSVKISKKSAAATPKHLQSAKKSATPKSQKAAKAIATPLSASMSQRSSVTKLASSKRTPRVLVTETSTPKSSMKSGTARKRLVSPLNNVRESIESRASGTVFSRDLQRLSGAGEHQFGRSSLGLQSLDRQSHILSSRAQSYLPNQSYQEEKAFAQYVERSAGGETERYGTTAMEHRIGDETYRSGSYRIQRERAAEREREVEEGQWEEGDGNNSALPAPEDLNNTFSTSVYSNRCAIL